MTKQTAPVIENLKFSELEIDTLYSGRDEKEIKANAKELASSLANGWDATQPGQYFIGEDGKKHLVAGFTRVEAAKLNDLKGGWFVEAQGSEIDFLTACIRTNGGKPISRKAQGARFISLRDGLVADDFAGAVADPESEADWKRKPMSLEEIAALPGVGKSVEHVKQCILVAEDPIFAENEELISVNAFIAARNLVNKHHDSSDTKLVKLINAALKVATDEGKDKVTPKHLDAVKADFIPTKKLVAAPVAENPDTAPATKSTSDSASEPQEATETKSESDAPESDTEPAEQPQLFTEPATAKLKANPTKQRKALETLLSECSEEYSLSATDDDIAGMADKIEAFYAKAGEVF